MPRFAKQQNCPASATLLARAAGRLAPLAAQAADSHLRACDFCAAELRLLAREDADAHAAPQDARADAPPMPLALRLFAESQLARVAESSPASRLRAA